MPRTYVVPFTATTVANASGDVDLFEFSPADDKPIELVGLVLAVHSELGDAAEEILQIQVLRGHTTGGSGGSAPTPVPVDPSDAAAGFTAEVLNTTVASAGTTTILYADGLNVRSGLQVWFPDGAGPRATQGNTTMVVRMMTAVADDVTMSGVAYVREV